MLFLSSVGGQWLKIKAGAPALTVTARPLPLLIVPSVTVMCVDSALYRVITASPAAPVVVGLATPPTNTIDSGVPKLTGDAEASVTLGTVPFGELLAPPNVRALVPL